MSNVPSVRLIACALAVLVTTVALTGTPAGAEPRSASVLRLSIWDVLRRAERTSEAMAVARAGVRRAAAAGVQARSGLFPQVTAFASYVRIFATEFDVLLENGPSAPRDGNFRDLPFGRENTWRFGVSAMQEVFSGGRTRAQMRMARAGRRQADVALGSTRAQVILEVAAAYYDAALSDRFVEIAEQTQQQAEQALADTRVAFEAGLQPEFEVLRAEVSAAGHEPTLIQRRMERELAYSRLKQRLDLDVDRVVVLTTRLEGEELLSLTAGARRLARAGDERLRAPVRQAAEAVRAGEASLDMARSGFWPTIALTAQYSRVAFPPDVLPAFDQLRTNFNVGMVLQLPLFEGLRTVGEVRAAQAELAEARARLRQTRKQTRLDTFQSRRQLEAARAVWEATRGVVRQAERAHEIALIRYDEGVSTQLEVTDARLQLEEARLRRAQAARDLQLARIRVALLQDLPLAPTLTEVAPVPGIPRPQPVVPGVPLPGLVPLPSVPARVLPGGALPGQVLPGQVLPGQAPGTPLL